MNTHGLKVLSEAEAEAKIAELMAAEEPSYIETPEQAAALHMQELQGFISWDQKLLNNNGFVIGYNDIMSQRSRQLGAKPGLNTGNGQFESRISAHLFLAYGNEHHKDDPDWWKDDRKFYAFLRKYPELDGRPGKNVNKGAKYVIPR